MKIIPWILALGFLLTPAGVGSHDELTPDQEKTAGISIEEKTGQTIPSDITLYDEKGIRGAFRGSSRQAGHSHSGVLHLRPYLPPDAGRPCAGVSRLFPFPRQAVSCPHSQLRRNGYPDDCPGEKERLHDRRRKTVAGDGLAISDGTKGKHSTASPGQWGFNTGATLTDSSTPWS